MPACWIPIAVLLVALAFGTTAAISRSSRSAFATLRWGRGLVLMTVVAVPWFAWMWLEFRDQFVRGYLLAGNLWYFIGSSNFPMKSVNHTFYVRVFTAAFFPWSLLVVGRLADFWTNRSLRQRITAPETQLWLWLLVVVGFFTAARFKLDQYIFPAAPACCLIATRAWLDAATDGSWKWTRRAIVTIAVSFVTLGIAGTVALGRVDLGLAHASFVLPLSLIAGGTAMVWQLKRSGWLPGHSLAVPLATLLVTYVCMVTFGLPVLEKSRPGSSIGRWLAKHVQDGDPVALYRLERFRATTRYYARRPIGAVDDLASLGDFLQQPGRRYVVMLRNDFDTARSAGLPIIDVFHRSIVVGTSGKGLRRQHWGSIVVVRLPVLGK